VANSGLLELYLSDTRVTDTGLGILDTMPALEALGLGRALVTAPSLVRIAKLSALRTLVLSGTRAPAESLALLGNLHALERLYLDQTLADSSVIAALDARNLRVLHLADTHVDDDALPALRTFALLGELTIGDSAVHAEIADLSAWPRLHTLSAVGLELGDAQLPLIARARRLERLDLSSTDVTDPAPLAALPNLKELGLGDTRLTRQGASSADALAKRGVVVVR
ncbi:MAG TPA: hypothetical protein VK427_25560, partial [Kofleriaceae bacterium]|nr:hypothetical protein [Kofleriaceae bacterium]